MQDRVVYSKDNRIIIRNDLLLSNWALLFYIVYMLKIVQISPLPIIIFATCVATTCVLIGIYYQNISLNHFLAYIIITFFLKIIPIYTIRNDKITKNVIILSLFVFITYLIYLDINNTSFLSIYKACTNNNPTQLGIYYNNIVKYIKTSVFKT